jgi:uncharacterized membrane protein YoaK (UPF0700 family)
VTRKTQASGNAYHLNKTAIFLATVAGYTDGYGLRLVTGALNKVGSHLALAARGTAPVGCRTRGDSHLWRAGVEGGLWLAFCAGAAFADFVTKRARGFELIPAVGILLFFGLLSRDHLFKAAKRNR